MTGVPLSISILVIMTHLEFQVQSMTMRALPFTLLYLSQPQIFYAQTLFSSFWPCVYASGQQPSHTLIMLLPTDSTCDHDWQAVTSLDVFRHKGFCTLPELSELHRQAVLVLRTASTGTEDVISFFSDTNKTIPPENQLAFLRASPLILVCKCIQVLNFTA